MSLEDALKENTAALAKLTAVLEAGVAAESGAAAASTSGKRGRPAKAEAEAPAPTTTKPDKPKPAGPTYDDVKDAILKVNSEKGRDEATAVLARFGVARATELKEGAWPDVIKMCQEVLSGRASAQDGDTEDELI